MTRTIQVHLGCFYLIVQFKNVKPLNYPDALRTDIFKVFMAL